MRILMVNKYAHVTGGADVNCLGLAQALVRRGHDVALLSTASPQNVFSEGEFIDASVTHASREDLGASRRVEVALRAIWNPTAAKAMRLLIGRFRPQVVHAHKLYPQLSVAPVIAAARASLPIVQTLHDYELMSASYVDHSGGWIDRDESRRSFRALSTATFIPRRGFHARKVDAWIANSRYVAARYETRGITSTVLPSFVEPVTGALLEFSDRYGAVFVGRLHEVKGVRDVIALAERVPSIEVSVAGHGPLEQAVAEAAGRLSNLDFEGSLDRAGVLRLLRRARVCVMPSRWQEPGGIAALEAMSVGTPVVAYASGGLAEYVSDVGGGRVVEPAAGALARECERLHRDERTWEELSQRGAAGVVEKHSPEAYAVAVERIYRRLIDRTQARSPDG